MSTITPLNFDRFSPAHRARLTLEVLATYLRVRATMRDDDAQRAVALLRERARAQRQAQRHTGALAPGEEVLAAWRLGRVVRRVLAVLPSDSRCLFRSLTLLCMLERRGIPHVLAIAVRPQPFGAHAWIEVGGEAVLPGADRDYERLLEL